MPPLRPTLCAASIVAAFARRRLREVSGACGHALHALASAATSFTAAALLVSATLARATVGESPVFSFDTRDDVTTTVAESGVFAFDTRLIDGLSGDGNSGGFLLDTRGSITGGLAITGPAALTGGAQATYAIQNAGVDVSIQATLGFSHAPVSFAGIGGNTLFTYPVSTPQAVQLLATYRGPGGQIQSAVFSVSVLPNSSLRASATATATPSGGTSYDVVLNGSASGGTAPYTFMWDTDNDGQYDDHSSQMSSYPLTSQGGTYLIKLELTDAQGAKAYATTRFTVDKPPVPNQPTKLAPVSGGGEGAFLSLAGNPFQFDSARVANGLIVVTHGLDSSGRETWIQELAARISAEIPIESRPNIVIYDWEHDANPNNLTLSPPASVGVKTAAVVSNKLGWMLAGRALGSITAADLVTDILGIKPMGMTHGQILGNCLIQESQASPARVDFSKKVHLIGHSAGGFVVGEAAWVLLQAGYTVDRVTMLDTPFPADNHVGFLPNPTVVERYVSSIFGALESPWTWGWGESDYYWVGATYFDSIWDFGLALTGFGHSKAHEWYRNTVYPDPGYEDLGFYFSPFKNGPMAPRYPTLGFTSKVAGIAANADESVPANMSIPSGSFQAFGSASEASGLWTISEGSDAGIFIHITLPPDAIKLRFKYQWSGTGDGDFLAVRFGARPEMMIGRDLDISRAAFLPAEVEIGALAGLEDDLIFTLVSRGGPGAVLQIKDIEVVQHSDADHDGLTTAQELAAGTNPMSPDSDDDGLSDGDEINLYFTNPMLADSDGDGGSDSAELIAGTSPTNGQSFLRVTDMTKNTGGTFTLHWPSQAGRFYNVQRSTDVTFATFEVIGQGIAAAFPQNTFVDTSAGSAPDGRFFYRIEVYAP